MPITMQEFADRLKKFDDLRNTQITNRILLESAKAIEGSMKERIFGQGKDTSDSQIANSYKSQKKKYTKDDFAGSISSKFSPNTTITVRKGENKGKKIPAMKFANYAAFRRYNERQTAYVDLSLSGSLQGNIKSGESGGDVVIGLTSLEESRKRKIIEKRLYKKDIFTPSRTDIQEGSGAIVEAIKAIIRGTNK